MSTASGPGMDRDTAENLLRQHLKNERLVNHCLASEAIMRALAAKFGEDEEAWGLAGLLHDLDFEDTADTPSVHAEKGAVILDEMGVDPEVTNAIRKHNAEELGLPPRETRFEHALACAETITGLIVATALVYPDKKISSVKVKSVTKRMKTPHFARNVCRETIMECEKIGLPLNDFVALSIDAMSGIADRLGL